jgi:hypothetical protein
MVAPILALSYERASIQANAPRMRAAAVQRKARAR